MASQPNSNNESSTVGKPPHATHIYDQEFQFSNLEADPVGEMKLSEDKENNSQTRKTLV